MGYAETGQVTHGQMRDPVVRYRVRVEARGILVA